MWEVEKQLKETRVDQFQSRDDTTARKVQRRDGFKRHLGPLDPCTCKSEVERKNQGREPDYRNLIDNFTSNQVTTHRRKLGRTRHGGKADESGIGHLES